MDFLTFITDSKSFQPITFLGEHFFTFFDGFEVSISNLLKKFVYIGTFLLTLKRKSDNTAKKNEKLIL
jgi:hypothetical protein